MKKLKYWLIKKLGGYVEQTPPAKGKEAVEPITIIFTTTVPMEFLRKRESRSFIGNCTLRLCARDLAEELIKRELCKVDRAVDYFKAYTYLKVSVTVIPPERTST